MSWRLLMEQVLGEGRRGERPFVPFVYELSNSQNVPEPTEALVPIIEPQFEDHSLSPAEAGGIDQSRSDISVISGSQNPYTKGTKAGTKSEPSAPKQSLLDCKVDDRSGAEAPRRCCYCCRGTLFWRKRGTTEWICARCHDPSFPGLAEEWRELSEESSGAGAASPQRP